MKYRSNIYFDAWGKVRELYPSYTTFIFIGGRGVGKTYSVLNGALKEGKKIMYARRTDTEMKNCTRETKNPYKKINRNENRDVHVYPDEDNFIIKDKDDLVGYACSLSGGNKVRGSDLSDVEVFVVDEFIKTTQIDFLRGNSFFLWCEIMETIGRNREIEGDLPLINILLSNSNSLNEPILVEFGLPEIIRNMKKEHRNVYVDEERKIYLELIEKEEFKEAKRETTMYKLIKGTSYYDMAIDNDFVDDYFGDVKRMNLKGYTPLFAYNDTLFVYAHKKTFQMYVCKSRSTNCDRYFIHNKKALKKDYGFMIESKVHSEDIIYSDYNTKLEFLKIWR